MGLPVSDAVRMLLVRVAAGNALPFEVKIPNATTVKAVRAADGAKGRVTLRRCALQGTGDLIVAERDQRRPGTGLVALVPGAAWLAAFHACRRCQSNGIEADFRIRTLKSHPMVDYH